MEIKIGDLIQSNTGACGIVIAVPDNEKNVYRYVLHWNQGEQKEWGSRRRCVENFLLSMVCGRLFQHEDL